MGTSYQRKTRRSRRKMQNLANRRGSGGGGRRAGLLPDGAADEPAVVGGRGGHRTDRHPGGSADDEGPDRRGGRADRRDAIRASGGSAGDPLGPRRRPCDLLRPQGGDAPAAGSLGRRPRGSAATVSGVCSSRTDGGGGVAADSAAGVHAGLRRGSRRRVRGLRDSKEFGLSSLEGRQQSATQGDDRASLGRSGPVRTVSRRQGIP